MKVRNVFINQNASMYLKYSWVVDALWILAAGYNSFFQNREFF